ncbi:MAG: amidase [Candidatus Protochlamydia sp.]|nr:amidase [Candidatus Protochlamydia sp.]
MADGPRDAPPFQIVEATISSVHAAIRKNELTSVELMTLYLERIKAYNLELSRGAPINAFVSINPSLFEDARRLDEYYKKNGEFIGPLHSIPVIVKDNIDTYDFPSTSGSLSMLGSQPTRDALLVKRLREAGAIIIGKGSMDEFGNGMTGISSRSGRIGNPYNPLLNPGGSSGGPAAAVNANFAIIGIGTDNSGSIRVPAAFNGLYGLRPTTSLISHAGIFPRGNLDAVSGPLARTVEDLAAVLTVIAQPEPGEGTTLSYDPSTGQGFKNKKIGLINKVFNINPNRHASKEVNKIYKNFSSKLTELGAILIEIELPDFKIDRKNNLAGEIDEINAYLSTFPSTRENFEDICKSNRTLSFGGTKGCIEHNNQTAPKESQTYQDTLNFFAFNRAYLMNVMKDYELDAFLMPISAHGTPNYDVWDMNTWTAPLSSNSGLPAIAVVAGYTKGSLPVGIELIGKMFTEKELIEMAYAYEKSSRPRQLPQMTGSSALKNATIPAMNNLFTEIGYQAFSTILLKEGPGELTPARFSSIVEELIRNMNKIEKH